MKILITSHTYSPNKDGVQFVTQYLAEGLIKRGHEVTVVTSHKNKNMKNEEINGVKVIRYRAYTKYGIHIGNKRRYQQLIKKLCNKHDILVCACLQCPTTDWILPIMDDIAIPKILYNHSIWDFKYSKLDLHTIKSFLSKTYFNVRWGAYYLTNSGKIAKFNSITQLHENDYSNSFFKKYIHRDSIIIENAVSNDFFSTRPKKENLPKKYYLNVANYSERKNQKNIIKLFLQSKISDEWHLILIGGSKNRYCKKLIKQYGNIKRVHILYGVDRNKIPEYVERASVFIMDSIWEAYPISIIEAMAEGVPWISSDTGIIKYLSGGITCKNDKEIIDAIELLSKDEQKRKELGRLGRKSATKEHRISQKVMQLEELLQNNLTI